MAMTDLTQKSFMVDIYNKYYKYMLGCAFTKLQNKELAEEAVQEAFVRLIKYVEKLMSLECNKIKPYIVTTTRNVCNDILQKKLGKPEILTENMDNIVDFMEINKVFIPEDFSNVDEAIKYLNPRYRLVLVYRYYFDYDYKTIAEEMEITVNNVGVLLKRASDALLKELVERRASNDG